MASVVLFFALLVFTKLPGFETSQFRGASLTWKPNSESAYKVVSLGDILCLSQIPCERATGVLSNQRTPNYLDKLSSFSALRHGRVVNVFVHATLFYCLATKHKESGCCCFVFVIGNHERMENRSTQGLKDFWT